MSSLVSKEENTSESSFLSKRKENAHEYAQILEDVI